MRNKKPNLVNINRFLALAPITPNFPFSSSREIVGDYVEK